MQRCSKEAGSRLKKYRRRCGLCESEIYISAFETYAVYHSVHYTVPLPWQKNWCRVSDIATNKNCDFTSGYEQFVRSNTLFYNPDSKHIKPNTNSNHKTDLTITLHFHRK